MTNSKQYVNLHIEIKRQVMASGLHRIRLFLFVIPVLIVLSAGRVDARELPKYLMATPGVVDIDTLETTNFFKEKYLVIFKQMIDYKDPDAGFFEQRVFISHYSFKNPVVFVTEGYSAEYAAESYYVNELSSLYNANQIVVEHRYFDKSVPDPLNYKYLTTENAAGDHHAIYMMLKNIYKGRWIATGISKGGETALLYNMYYPNDMAATVAYVAPVALAVDDGRHAAFITQVGTPADRKAVLTFQKELLKRKDTMIPLLENFSKKNKLTYRLPIAEIFDYCVLEFSFAFWQWGVNPETIPDKGANDATLFRFLTTVCPPDYFAIEGIEPTFPFFYQAARELGYYSYDITPFEKMLTIKSSEDYFYKIFLPPDMTVEFIPETAKKLTRFMQEKARNVVLVYGEYDPWSAAAADIGVNQGVVKVIYPGGSHMSQIKSLPQLQHERIITTIAGWIK